MAIACLNLNASVIILLLEESWQDYVFEFTMIALHRIQGRILFLESSYSTRKEPPLEWLQQFGDSSAGAGFDVMPET